MLSELGLIFQSCSCGMVSEEPHYRPFTFVEDCTNNSTMGKCLSIKECDNVDNVCTLWNIGTGKNKTKDVCAVRSTNTGKSKITDWSTFIFHILVLNKLRGHLYLMMSCLKSGTVWAFFSPVCQGTSASHHLCLSYTNGLRICSEQQRLHSSHLRDLSK